MTTKQVCSVEVSEPGTWGAFHQHPCTKPVKVERDGKPYCTVHDPEYIKVKEGAKCSYRLSDGYGNRCGKSAVEVDYAGFGRCALHTRAAIAAKERLASAAPDLLEAAKAALAHVKELEDAWRRGAISEHDTGGGTRSNRNVDVRVALRAAITKAQGRETT